MSLNFDLSSWKLPISLMCSPAIKIPASCKTTSWLSESAPFKGSPVIGSRFLKGPISFNFFICLFYFEEKVHCAAAAVSTCCYQLFPSIHFKFLGELRL